MKTLWTTSARFKRTELSCHAAAFEAEGCGANVVSNTAKVSSKVSLLDTADAALEILFKGESGGV